MDDIKISFKGIGCDGVTTFNWRRIITNGRLLRTR